MRFLTMDVWKGKRKLDRVPDGERSSEIALVEDEGVEEDMLA